MTSVAVQEAYRDHNDPSIWRIPGGYRDVGAAFCHMARAAIIDVDLPTERILQTAYDGCQRLEGVKGLFKTPYCRTVWGLRREWRNAGLYVPLLNYALEQRAALHDAIHGSGVRRPCLEEIRIGFSTMHRTPAWHVDEPMPRDPSVNVCVINLIGDQGTRIAHADDEKNLSIPVPVLNAGEAAIQAHLDNHFAARATMAQAGQAVLINLARGVNPPVRRPYHAGAMGDDRKVPRASLVFDVPPVLRQGFFLP